jgi:phosphatidylserine/phosphatidylglycerophosphate/cardiolipin synthase-like enzyme
MTAKPASAVVESAFLEGMAAPAAMCQLQPYKKRKVPAIDVDGRIVLYASPDSTYAVTKPLFEQAEKSILIGIYDFTAGYVKEWVLSALQRGVAVELMLDVSPTSSGEEADLFRELQDKGVDAVPAPSCTSKIHPTFHHSHEKVIVVDDRWCFVQSGNYSRSSIPRNLVDGGTDADWVHGNRDTGILFDSPELAAFFSKVLRADMKIVTGAAVPAIAAAVPAGPPAPVAAAPKKVPVHRPSKTVTLGNAVRVQPVLTPDNYLDEVEALLASATKSICIEQQYIRTRHAEVRRLLDAIGAARQAHPQLQVRIIVAGPSFGPDPQIAESLADLRADHGLATGKNVRLLNGAYFAHCHNKLVVVDQKITLISSQNWSSTAVATNREAGVIVPNTTVARYFQEIFDADWATAVKAVPAPTPGPLPAVALATGTTIPITLSDYEEV